MPNNSLKRYTATLLSMHDRLGSWQHVAGALGGGFSKATWRDAAMGRRKLSRRAENMLRFALGYAPVGQTKIWQFGEQTMRRYLRTRGEMGVTHG